MGGNGSAATADTMTCPSCDSILLSRYMNMQVAMPHVDMSFLLLLEGVAVPGQGPQDPAGPLCDHTPVQQPILSMSVVWTNEPIFMLDLP